MPEIPIILDLTRKKLYTESRWEVRKCPVF